MTNFQKILTGLFEQKNEIRFVSCTFYSKLIPIRSLSYANSALLLEMCFTDEKYISSLQLLYKWEKYTNPSTSLERGGELLHT